MINQSILEVYKAYMAHTQHPHVSATLTLAQALVELIDSFQEEEKLPELSKAWEVRQRLFDARRGMGV